MLTNSNSPLLFSLPLALMFSLCWFTLQCRMQGKRFPAVVFIVLICFAITVCNLGPDDPVSLTYDEAVKKVEFTDDLATVDFTNLDGHDIYLVVINSSDIAVPAANTGGVVQPIPVVSSGEDTVRMRSAANGREDSFYHYHMAELERSAALPPLDKGRAAGLAVNSVSYSVGSKKGFWVERNFGGNIWEYKQATLMASGEYENIWVMDENISSGTSEYEISEARARELAGRFDLIYPLATNLLGFEYGGGPDGNGGIDGDKKIQILVFDFYDRNYRPGETTYAGYFWSKDFFTQAELDNMGWGSKTNLAEIFYINAGNLINNPDFIYSTLIHEFQHMINFNRKYVVHDENSATWYNEMLSTMAQDVIAPLIGIGHANAGHPVSTRIPGFLDSYYRYGITEWNDHGNNYANVYAFGAYLLRNYGGPVLLKNILDNDMVDIDSITMALNEFSEDIDFMQALTRYGEAMIFSGSSMPKGGADGIDVVSFDKTATSTVNGQKYTAYGFDIWRIIRRDTNDLGPFVYDLRPASMRPHSVIVKSADGWKNKTGDFSITLEKPSNQDVVLYLMAR